MQGKTELGKTEWIILKLTNQVTYFIWLWLMLSQIKNFDWIYPNICLLYFTLGKVSVRGEGSDGKFQGPHIGMSFKRKCKKKVFSYRRFKRFTQFLRRSKSLNFWAKKCSFSLNGWYGLMSLRLIPKRAGPLWGRGGEVKNSKKSK